VLAPFVRIIMIRFNKRAMLHLLLPVMLVLLACSTYFAQSSQANLQIPPNIHHCLKQRVSKCLQRQRKRVTSHASVGTNQIQYPWRQHIIANPKQSGIGSFLLIQSATEFLALLPHKRYILIGVAAYYAFHKVRKSEPIQRSIYFWTRAGPVVLHYKFTKWWFTTHPTINRIDRDIVYERLHNRYAPITYQIILHLRGLYVKMGQILSSRPDFMPIQYIQYFTKLQDSIPAIDTETIRKVAVEALQIHCSDAYSEYASIVFDPVPLGSASIGQVHRAVLRRKPSNNNKSDASQEVAIKVMHKNAKQKFKTDFQVFRWLCRIAIPSWLSLLNALEEQVMTEFDYRREAQSLQTVRDSIMHSSSRYRHRVCVPQPIHELCCENVLVMEMLHGKKLIDSIRDSLVDAFHNNTQQVDKFLEQRQKEILFGTVQDNSNNISKHHRQHCKDDQTNRQYDQGSIPISSSTLLSHEILDDSVGFLGKIKLLFLLHQCRTVIDLLVDVHGYQIFHRGTLR
jgi:aarF domain-containing kinase